jgi:hypothetical protein
MEQSFQAGTTINGMLCEQKIDKENCTTAADTIGICM